MIRMSTSDSVVPTPAELSYLRLLKDLQTLSIKRTLLKTTHRYTVSGCINSDVNPCDSFVTVTCQNSTVTDKISDIEK